jgi:hypothetical protein
MKRMLSMLVAIALGSAALAACGATTPPSTTSAPALGSISGTFTLDAGLSHPRPIHGTVSFTREHKTATVRVHVGVSGRFRVHLPPGEWLVSGRSPMFSINDHDPPCGSSKPFVVTADRTTSVQVLCVGK